MIKVKYSENFITHTVQPGDSFNWIAKQYNNTVSSILAANPYINPNYIYCGQRLYIPIPISSSNAATTKIGKKEKIEKMEVKQKETEKQQVIENCKGYMAECEKIKKQYAELLKECKKKGSEIEPGKTNSEIPEEIAINVGGIWYTNWGEMILNQSGKNVSGTYTWDDGKISGVLNENVLTGTWSEMPTYSAPRDAGTIEFIFNQNSFTGTWGFGDEPLSGYWEGTRA